ncbi:MAG: glycosyltransferase, partial [bacterium]
MPLPANPALTVVIVVFAAGEAIRTTWDAVVADTSYPHQTILLHNGSPHVDPADLRAFPGATVWETGTNLGYAGAINYALEKCDSDLVGIWNDDAAPRPGAFRAMVDA